MTWKPSDRPSNPEGAGGPRPRPLVPLDASSVIRRIPDSSRRRPVFYSPAEPLAGGAWRVSRGRKTIVACVCVILLVLVGLVWGAMKLLS